MKKWRDLMIVFIAAMTVSCDLDSNTISTGGGGTGESQKVVCNITETEDYLYKNSSYTLDINGMLISSPLPDLEYFEIDNKEYTSAENYSVHPGYIEFFLTPDDVEELNISETVYFEISTEYGYVHGSVSRPPLIEDIKINGTPADYSGIFSNSEINLSERLEVSWSYGSFRPDFLRIHGVYTYNDGYEQGQIQFNEYIDNERSDFLLFMAGILEYDGDVVFNIVPYNGPLPTDDQASNLFGDGTGTLYWSHLPDYCELKIQVGGGYREPENSPDQIK